MKKLVGAFTLVLMFSSMALGYIAPDKKAEVVIDPTTGDQHMQCINPGSNCDAG